MTMTSLIDRYKALKQQLDDAQREHFEWSIKMAGWFDRDFDSMTTLQLLEVIEGQGKEVDMYFSRSDGEWSIDGATSGSHSSASFHDVLLHILNEFKKEYIEFLNNDLRQIEADQ